MSKAERGSHPVRWFEIGQPRAWGINPSGIPRVTQNLFLESLRDPDLRYTAYDRDRDLHVAIRDIESFVDLAHGRRKFTSDLLADCPPLLELVQAHDSLFMGDTGWTYHHYLDALRALRLRVNQGRMSTLIYDLIPLRYPQYFAPDRAASIEAYVRGSAPLFDHFMCISQATERDLRETLQPQASTSVIRLANQLPDDHSCEATDEALPPGPGILCVGTVEVRKNHILLYQAWRRLRSEMGDACPYLWVVGREGWLAGDVSHLMATDPLTRDRIIRLGIVPDSRLRQLYRNCRFTVYPSLAEGWGLPVAESLAYGRLCVTSNNSSMPEVNPLAELMVSPDDAAALSRVLRRLITDEALCRALEDEAGHLYQVRSWSDAYSELRQAAWMAETSATR